MLSRRQFKDRIKRLIDLKKTEEMFNKVLKQIDPDSYNYVGFNKYETLIVDCLKDAMEDNTEESWIDYWLYELDYGKEAKKNTVKFDNKNTPIKTIDDLYNILCRNKGD